ncbi:MAG: hypothetical protein GX097_06655, partial [Methanomicrobiales archaeon]|nr:hypothetical protein [Methanomicrobiales archaeon]
PFLVAFGGDEENSGIDGTRYFRSAIWHIKELRALDSNLKQEMMISFCQMSDHLVLVFHV